MLAVLGLDDRPQASPQIRRTPGLEAAAAGAAAPDLLHARYRSRRPTSFPAGTDGTGQTIAIIELGGGFGSTDLDTYFSGLGITAPPVTAVGVDGGSNVAGEGPAGRRRGGAA